MSTQTLTRVEELAREAWPADAESAVLASDAEPQIIAAVVVATAVVTANQFGGCQTLMNSCVHPGELN